MTSKPSSYSDKVALIAVAGQRSIADLSKVVAKLATDGSDVFG